MAQVVSGFPLGVRSIVDRVFATTNSGEVSPSYSSHALKAIQKQNLSIDAMVDVIESDMFLAVRLMQLANRHTGAGKQSVRGIREAIELLGPQTTRSAMISFFAPKGATVLPEPAVEFAGIRKYSLAVACASRVLARTCCPDQEHQAYLVGLIHEIGVLMLQQTFEHHYEKLVKDCPPHRTLAEYEEVCMGISHAEVGALLLDRWGLPEIVQHLVRHHHDEILDSAMEYSETQPYRILRVSVECGRLLCGERSTELVRRVHDAASHHLGLSIHSLKPALGEMAKHYSEALRRTGMEATENGESQSPAQHKRQFLSCH